MDRLLQMPIAEYHARKELSHSQLSRMVVPAVFKHEVLDGHRLESTNALDLGQILHTLLMEPEKFDSIYAVAQKFDRRYSAEKEREKAFLEANAGKLLCESDKLEQAKAMAASIRAHKEAKLLVENALFERSIFWRDASTGLSLRCRPDALRPTMGIKIDVKTSADVSPRAFARSLYQYNYATQAAFYRDGCADAGIPIENDVLIAVCSEAPYLCAVYEIESDTIAWGRARYRRWLERYQECTESGVWPGYLGIQTIGLPGWAKMEDA